MPTAKCASDLFASTADPPAPHGAKKRRITMLSRWLRHMVVSLAVAVATVAATAHAYEAQLERVESSRAVYDARVAEFETLRAQYEAEMREIDRLKQPAFGGLVNNVELQRALRDAYASAERLQALDAALREAERVHAARVDELRDAVERRSDVIERGLPTAPDLDTAVAELHRLQQVLDAYEAPLPAYVPVPLDAIVREAESLQTSIDLYATAEELADHERRIERQLEEMRRELDRARSRETLERRAFDLARDERFFDDGVARRAPRGANAQDEPLATGAPESDEGRTNAENDSASPGGEAPARDFQDDAPAVDMGTEAAHDNSPDSAPPDFGAEPDAVSGGGRGSVPLPVPAWDVDIRVPVRAESPDTASPSADPNLLRATDVSEDRTERRGRRGRADELSEREAQLLQELERVREERHRILRDASELERDGW